MSSFIILHHIEKIEVYEKPAKFKHNQLRQIDIYYRDVGLLDVVIPIDVKKAMKSA